MKNKNGFTLVELLATVVIIAILGGVATISVNYLIQGGKDDLYKDYENTLKTEAENYLIEQMIDGTLSLPRVGESQNIYLSDLIANNKVQNLKDPNGGVCSAVETYVKVSRGNDNGVNYNLTYETCLVCPNYKTEGC